ncbi:MAG TPA: cell division protein FtsA [Patescibacteria group bacterium]|nr:cell division protein FtsA [Patescibacteria group bacterium]
MAKTKVITAIDIGTEKVCTVIAGQSPEGALQILGISSIASKGIKKSQIVDLEEAIEAIIQSLDGAERMAGFGVSSAYVSVSGTHISSQNSKGVVAVASPDGEITATDIDRVIEAARAISLPSAREIIHVIPREFQVDGQSGIKDPVGMSGIRLEAEAHIISGSATALRNLTKCLSEVGITVSGFVFAGLASSLAVLSETEKELGVVLLDIGAGSTSMAIYVEGALTYSAVLPIGARHVTQDIALGTHLSLAAAEKIKLALADMPPESDAPSGETREQRRERLKREDEMDLKRLGIDEGDTLSRKMVVENIMVPRMKEMFELVGKELEKEKLFPLIPAGIVLSGGGALTVGMTDVCKRTLSLSTRVGVPTGVRGLIEDVESPIFTTAMGLILYGAKNGGEEVRANGSGFSVASLLPKNFSKLPEKIISLFKSLLP